MRDQINPNVQHYLQLGYCIQPKYEGYRHADPIEDYIDREYLPWWHAASHGANAFVPFLSEPMRPFWIA